MGLCGTGFTVYQVPVQNPTPSSVVHDEPLAEPGGGGREKAQPMSKLSI